MPAGLPAMPPMFSNARIGPGPNDPSAIDARLTAELSDRAHSSYRLGRGGRAPRDRTFGRPQHYRGPRRPLEPSFAVNKPLIVRAHAQPDPRTHVSCGAGGGWLSPRAARKLALSPSTALDHIRQLEADLWHPCSCVRERGKVQPTAHGAQHSSRWRGRWWPLQNALTEVDHQGASAGRRIQQRRDLQPSSRCLLHSGRSTALSLEPWIGPNRQPSPEKAVRVGLSDVAVMEWWDGRPGFDAMTWRQEPLKVIVAPDHHWAGRRTIAASELVDCRDTQMGDRVRHRHDPAQRARTPSAKSRTYNDRRLRQHRGREARRSRRPRHIDRARGVRG